MPSLTPRCIIVRHGQTEWSKSGQYTGLTDLPLTPYGEGQMLRTGESVFRNNQFLNPDNITYIFTSPRLRARQTVDLVLKPLSDEQRAKIRVVVDDDLREWEYGDYEGMLTREIIELRKSRGLDKERPWNIWRDGCENGETTQQIGLRLSRVIARTRTCTASTRVRAEHQTSWSLRTDMHCVILLLFGLDWVYKRSVRRLKKFKMSNLMMTTQFHMWNWNLTDIW